MLLKNLKNVHPATGTRSAISMLKYFQFTSFIRDVRDTRDAVEGAVDCLASDDEEVGDVLDGRATPARSGILAARLRIDAVSSLLQRRVLHTAMQVPRGILSVHIQSDGSPVTGDEIQGMIMDICYGNNHIERTILLGVQFQGHFL